MRARLAAAAAGWRALTAAQRAGWNDLAFSIIKTDSLGQASPVTGFQAFVSVNANNALVGNASVTDAPLLVTPPTILTATVTLTVAAFSVAFTPTPLGAGVRLLAFCSAQRSAGRSFESDIRFIVAGAAATASPLVATAAYTAKFGLPIVGNRVFMRFKTYAAGFLSGPFDMSQVVA